MDLIDKNFITRYLASVGVSCQHAEHIADIVLERRINIPTILPLYFDFKKYVYNYSLKSGNPISEIENISFEEMQNLVNDAKDFFLHPNCIYKNDDSSLTVDLINLFDEIKNIPDYLGGVWLNEIDCHDLLDNAFRNNYKIFLIQNKKTGDVWNYVLAIRKDPENITYLDHSGKILAKDRPFGNELISSYEQSLNNEILNLIKNN